MRSQRSLQLLTVLNFIIFSFAVEPFTIGAVIFGSLFGGATIGGLWSVTKCKFYECCEEPMYLNPVGSDRAIRRALEAKVYGQHIAVELIAHNVHNHMNDTPKKPLVMSFHGGTGVGKNHVSRIIAEILFKKGYESRFNHLIISTLHFPRPDMVVEYQQNLRDWVRGNLSVCPRSLFIFDEIDKMPVGVLNGLSAYIDYHDTTIEGADPRNAIFIFLSNTGRRRIDEITYQAWEAGKARESLTILDFQKALQLGAFNEGDNIGMYRSDIIKQELIDIYIPFLPLERKHVEHCIRDYLKERNLTVSEELVAKVAGDLDYFPPDDGLFSATGCKRIRERIVSNSRYYMKKAEIEFAKEDL